MPLFCFQNLLTLLEPKIPREWLFLLLFASAFGGNWKPEASAHTKTVVTGERELQLLLWTTNGKKNLKLPRLVRAFGGAWREEAGTTAVISARAWGEGQVICLQPGWGLPIQVQGLNTNHWHGLQMAKTQLWSLWKFPFPFFPGTHVPQGGIPREILPPGPCLGTERRAFDPKPLALAENCLLAQPESCQHKQGRVRGFLW